MLASKKSATLLERLHLLKDDISTRGKRIARYLEAGYPHAGLETADALGKRIDVSASTIVRFIAKLGYSGYAEFQSELRGEVEARLVSPLQRLTKRHIEGDRSERSDNIATRSFEAAISALSKTYGALDPQELEAAAKLLAECRGSIWVVGEKKPRSIALYLYAQLNLCLDQVILVSDNSFEADSLLDIGKQDIVVLLDVRRYLETTRHAADWCQQRGATLIVLSDSRSSPLYGRTAHHFAAATASAGAFDTYVGLMLVADALTNAVTVQDPEHTRLRLELGEEAWTRFGIFSSQQRPAESEM